MRLYRVTIIDDTDQNLGFIWCSSEREARKEAAKARSVFPRGHQAHVDVVEIKPTKAGILAALKVYATHPDNG